MSLSQNGVSDIAVPPKMQSEMYTGPLSIERFRKIEEMQDLLNKKCIEFPAPDCKSDPAGSTVA